MVRGRPVLECRQCGPLSSTNCICLRLTGVFLSYPTPRAGGIL